MLEPYKMVVINVIASGILLAGLLFYTQILKRKVNLLALLIIISLLPLISILRKGSYESGDLTLHAKFTAQFFDNIMQGNLIPEWMGRHCATYGCPVYIFIFFLPYYIASIFHFAGFSFVDSVKILAALSYILSGIGMYVWIKDELGEKSAFVAGIFYLFAPFHLIDLHFRVSIGELLSMAFFPFAFFFTKKIIEKQTISTVIAESIIFGFMILSHQVSSLVSLPLLVGYGFLVWLRSKRKKILPLVLLGVSLLIGMLLTAFYWLPILLEGKLTWYVADDKIEFHPITSFLFSPNRYGLLFQGHFGELYFNVGYTEWIIVALAIYILLKHKVKHKEFYLLGAVVGLFVIFFTLMQEITRPIWNIMPFFKNFQFTWRLMLENIFLISVMAGIVVKVFKNKYFIIALCLITSLYTILNWGNRKTVYPMTDEMIYSQKLFDERPNWVDITTPRSVDRSQAWVGSIPAEPIEILSGQKSQIIPLVHDMTKHEYLVNATTPLVLKENTYYYPGWQVKINNKPVAIDYKNKKYTGVITFDVPKGLAKIDVVFNDTRDRWIAKMISLGTMIALIIAGIFFLLFRNMQLEKAVTSAKEKDKPRRVGPRSAR